MAVLLRRSCPFKLSSEGVAPAQRGRGVSREGRGDVGGARRGARGGAVTASGRGGAATARWWQGAVRGVGRGGSRATGSCVARAGAAVEHLPACLAKASSSLERLLGWAG